MKDTYNRTQHYFNTRDIRKTTEFQFNRHTSVGHSVLQALIARFYSSVSVQLTYKLSIETYFQVYDTCIRDEIRRYFYNLLSRNMQNINYSRFNWYKSSFCRVKLLKKNPFRIHRAVTTSDDTDTARSINDKLSDDKQRTNRIPQPHHQNDRRKILKTIITRNM